MSEEYLFEDQTGDEASEKDVPDMGDFEFTLTWRELRQIKAETLEDAADKVMNWKFSAEFAEWLRERASRIRSWPNLGDSVLLDEES
jgi:hypothetical protein